MEASAEKVQYAASLRRFEMTPACEPNQREIKTLKGIWRSRVTERLIAHHNRSEIHRQVTRDPIIQSTCFEAMPCRTASHRVAPHRIASPCLALHRLSLQRIALHGVALHQCIASLHCIVSLLCYMTWHHCIAALCCCMALEHCIAALDCSISFQHCD